MVVWPDGSELAAEGVCDGTIAEQERGERGFGYDPVFVPVDGDGRTFAEMTDEREERPVAPGAGAAQPAQHARLHADEQAPVVAAGDVEVDDPLDDQSVVDEARGRGG